MRNTGIYNITYEGMDSKTIYKQVPLGTAKATRAKKGFKCFMFNHTPVPDGIGCTTQIQMITPAQLTLGDPP